MNSHPQPRSRLHGFTLVELLTVIAIIAILMGLLFPVLGIIKDKAHYAAAKTACLGIITAVKAYNTEYGKYPEPRATAPSTPADAIVGESTGGAGGTVGNENLFNTLRAKAVGTNASHALNPRRIVFFDGKDAANTAAPKGGFGSSGAFFDPWGAQYCVAIDLDYDNQLGTLPYLDFPAAKAPQTGCGAYSLGKDGVLGTKSTSGGTGDKYYKSTGGIPSDDVISWQ